MQKVITPNPVTGDNFEASDYITLQGRAVGVRPASAGEWANIDPAYSGLDGVHFVKATGCSNATPTLIDANHDWRDRVLSCEVSDLTAAANRPGGATDYTDWPGPTKARGYTRTGALSNVGTGAAVANAAPPVSGTGAGGTSSRITIGTSVWLYADPTTGALWLYNGSGATAHIWLEIFATCDLGIY